MSIEVGKQAELLAQQYLINQGLSFISSNFHSRFGEIDLIMQDKDVLVFVEVKRRYSNDFGSAIDSVTYHKQQKLRKAAGFYLLKNNWANKYRLRFDIVGIDGTPQQITWIPNAFGQG